jgi:hypothetical protein
MLIEHKIIGETLPMDQYHAEQDPPKQKVQRTSKPKCFLGDLL